MEKINLTSSQIAWLKSQTKESWSHLFRAYSELEKFASEKDEDMFYDIIIFFYKNIQINIILYQILYISRLKNFLRE